MTYSQAVAKATRLAKQNEKHYFVVEEIKGEIDVCNEIDLDTFYCGINPDRILFCTEELEHSAW